MKNVLLFVISAVTIVSCKSSNTAVESVNTKNIESAVDFKIAFGSCNRTDLENHLWDDILKQSPDVWIWGGDNVYADTDDMNKLRNMYNSQNDMIGYMDIVSKIPVIGTWDDHDYGLNDGGVEHKSKKESQQEFLNFMNVPENSPRRKQEGVYTSHNYSSPKGSVKIIVLDTRYFRTAVTPDTKTKKRLKPNEYGTGTVLGKTQWQWFKQELGDSTTDFNIIVSSIQVLSKEHGFEAWGNFPHEVDKFENMIADSKAKGVIVLSGDRHISEFSRTTVDGLDYPLIDFTSSGLTHAYRSFTGEPNPYRVGEVIFTESFGTLDFDFEAKKVTFKILGDEGKTLATLVQRY